MTNLKYEIVESIEIKAHNGSVLHRIRALRDIPRYYVKFGDLGGWIGSEENLSHDGDCWVFGDAKVFGKAKIFEDARVSGTIWVTGNAQIFGDAEISGNAVVSGDTKISGGTLVSPIFNQKNQLGTKK